MAMKKKKIDGPIIKSELTQKQDVALVHPLLSKEDIKEIEMLLAKIKTL